MRFPRFLFLPLLVSSFSLAQLPDGAPFSLDAQMLLKAGGDLRQEKPSSATVLLDEHTFTFQASGATTEERHLIYRVNSPEGVESWSESSAEWEPWHQERPDIRARVMTPDDGVHELDPKTLTDVPIHEDAPDLYSDGRRFGGPLPAVAEGAVVEELITIADTAPFFEGGVTNRVYFVRTVPSLKTRLVLRHPARLALKYVLHLLPDAKIEKQSTDGLEQVVITNGKMEAIDSVDHVPSDAVIYPQVEFGAGGSWHEVAQKYAEATSRRIAPSPNLTLKLPQSTSFEETIRSVVSALHRQVRYTGVEFGEAQLTPQAPSETLKRGYGDCKDKSALLVAMLQSKNIPAYLALLETGPGQDVNPELPGMGRFDHAIVYVPGQPDLWIDATAEHTRVGYLPTSDQGRLALIVRDETTSLVKTPESSSTDNLLVEEREVHLAEYGPASFSEVSLPHGDAESEYRSYYTKDQKKDRQKGLEKYVKSVYLADSLSRFETSDTEDLQKPFSMRLEAPHGKRGVTELNDAALGIQHGYITDRLPSYFREEQDDKDSDSVKKRTLDFVLMPFVTEWHYKIFLPSGFRIRSLPAQSEQQFGPAKLTQEFKENSDGSVVEALIRFDTVKSRFTPQQAAALREANIKFQKSDLLLLSFDHMGHALMSSGKIAEGLAIYQGVVVKRPNDALENVRFANALLSAGLGEKARIVAKKAVQQDPKSAVAHSTLAWILQHDLVGRRFKTGFDYEGALTAYRAALAIDPKDLGNRANYAILLEHDKWGIRYTKHALLDEAIKQFRQLQKDDEKEFAQYQDNILYDLFYLGRYQELLNEAAGLSKTDTRRQLTVAATAALQSVEAAKQQAAQITNDDQSRNKTLIAAGQALIRVRMYPQASELLSAGSQGQSESQTNLTQINSIAKTRRFEEVKIDDNDPVSVLQRMALQWFSLEGSYKDYLALISKNGQEGTQEESLAKAAKELPKLRAIVLNAELPPDVFLDLVISNIKLTKDGNDEQGYRIAMQSVGAATQHFYVVKEDGKYKVLASGENVPDIGREVLDRLQRGDVKAARVMLDFARDRQTLGGGDDLFQGRVFPRFWTKGQDADSEVMRGAAVALLVDDDSIKDHITALETTNQKTFTEPQRTNFDLALAHSYVKLERWKDLLLVSERLMKASPTSTTAFGFYEAACQKQQQWGDCEAAAVARLQRDPDDLAAKRAAARNAFLQGKKDSSLEQYRKIAADSRATQADLNMFAWTAIFTDSVPEDAIAAAQRASNLTQNRDYSVLHTVACVYAEIGKTAEARDLLIRALQAGQLPEPDAPLWYGFGRIAESYGQYDAAIADYKRVEIPKTQDPTTTYSLAQIRLRGLLKNHPEVAKLNN